MADVGHSRPHGPNSWATFGNRTRGLSCPVQRSESLVFMQGIFTFSQSQLRVGKKLHISDLVTSDRTCSSRVQ
ncbi:unnamed protein product [Allacma fusca]|uniref:Uncharacterized protein n=1 Tax=Allacma fusca TaxID=39272 RepID=A0A8J2L9E1_9HEXA|nr:unnamed protein product [Allacma fusca]